MFGVPAWLAQAWNWWMAAAPMWALALLGVLGMSYITGPGWLPHDPCPYCCWCSGRVPFGDRLEQRVFGWFGRLTGGGR